MNARMTTATEMDDISRNQRRNPTAEENEGFLRWLAEENGVTELPEDVKSKLFGKAWEDGHAYGYGEVAIHYAELADLVFAAYQAGRR